MRLAKISSNNAMKRDNTEHSAWHQAVAYFAVFLIGIILVFVSQYILRHFLLTALAISVSAAGFTGTFTSLVGPKFVERIARLVTDLVGAPAIFLQERKCLADLYLRLSRTAKEMDVISLSMEVILDNYSEEDLVDWILVQGKRLRILVLSPEGDAARIRGREERINLEQKIAGQIERLRRGLYTSLEKKRAAGANCRGSLEVRSYDSCPYFAYFRADRDIIIGLYYSHLVGLQSECLQVHDVDHAVYKKLRAHFNALWENGLAEGVPPNCRVICRVSDSESSFITAKHSVATRTVE